MLVYIYNFISSDHSIFHPLRCQYYEVPFAADIAVAGLDVVEVRAMRLLLLGGIRGLVPGLALAGTRLVVELDSIALLVASAFANRDMIDDCVASVCCESILSSVDKCPVSVVDDAECWGEDDASNVDKSIPIPASAPINILVLLSVS